VEIPEGAGHIEAEVVPAEAVLLIAPHSRDRVLNTTHSKIVSYHNNLCRISYYVMLQLY
jgi:hypothetical protein